MKLPDAKRAVVEQGKITDYLLNPAHPDNGGKAAFFLALGFRQEEWQTLAAFRRLAEKYDIHNSMESAHGRKYILDGRIETPSGKTPMVRTVWIVDRGVETPRLVTAYPQEK